MSVVLYEVKERVAYITLNRPEKRNALNKEVTSELLSAFNRAEADLEVKVIVLRSTGEAFCAGADLAYLQQLQKFSFDENLHDSLQLKSLFEKIYLLTKPVIAQVQGHALAGGCGLATVCDFVFAVPESKFGYTEVKIGFVPALVMVFLMRKIGEQRARYLLLSGELLLAEEAMHAGLINFCVEKSKLEQTVTDFAQRLIKNNSSQSMQRIKQMMNAIQSMSLEEALVYASRQNAEARSTKDCRKGIHSFLNKERISW